jgi:NMD protein affecting ribosome stability and mRNA decay
VEKIKIKITTTGGLRQNDYEQDWEGGERMSEIKACPFCGGAKICTEKGININYCDNCSAESNIEQWNTRPIEDALQARIDELETELNLLKQERDFDVYKAQQPEEERNDY